MCGFIRCITRFSLLVLSAAILVPSLIALALILAPRLLLQGVYYGMILLCILTALSAAAAALRFALAKH